MDIELKIKNIIVIISSGADIVNFISGNIKTGCWPFDTDAFFKTEVAKGQSREWLVKNFGEEILETTRFIKTT